MLERGTGHELTDKKPVVVKQPNARNEEIRETNEIS